MKKIIIMMIMLLPFISLSNNDCTEKCKINATKVEKTINNKDFNKISKDEFLNSKYIIYSALWCSHCRAEYKHLQEIYEKYPDNFNIIVFINNSNDKKEILDYFNKENYTFPIYYDEDNYFMENLQIEYFPTILEYNITDEGIVINRELNEFNLNNFYENNKKEIDNSVREKLNDINVIDINGDKLNLLNILTENAIVMYGAPWCPDCQKETEHIIKTKGDKDYIYLVDPKKYTYEEFIDFTKDKELPYKMYYVNSSIIRDRFNINWIPSTFEIKDGYITNTFKEIK